MTKKEFKDKIKKAINQIQDTPSKVDLDKGNNIVSFDTKFPILIKFPSLRDILVDLLTDQYEVFIKEIQWVAPRPTTFKVIFNNGQGFYLIYTDKSWIAKIEGKKYYLLNLPEEDRAAESIARILSYAWNSEPEKEPEAPSSPEEPEPEPEPETPEEETPPVA
jgi:hypothetical protein